MKKSFVFAMAAAALLFTACKNDIDTNVTNDEGAVQRISLMVENAGSNTRAGRELLSSEAKQSIENVKVIIVNASNEIVKIEDLDDWDGADATAYTSGGHGRKAEIVYEGNDRLSDATYTIYAFGYHDGSDYQMGGSAIDTYLDALTTGTVFAANQTITTTHEYAEEIFAGSQTMTISGKKVSTTIVLHRQVAGVFVYAKEIPYVAGAAKLSLYASDNHPSLVLGNFAPASPNELAANGTNTSNKVVNGFGAAVNTKIASVTLLDWFNAITEDANHLITGTAANWKGDATKFNTGSVFMGKFIVPFTQHATNTTFVLKLEDNSNNELRKWNIKLPAADIDNTANYTYWNTGATPAEFTVAVPTETQLLYNIYRNHLYGVGEKLTDNNQGPTDPDPDEPQTLNTKEDLLLKVNDNWEVIHTMEIE